MQQLGAYNLKSFYNSLKGRIVRRIVREKILSLWPEIKSQNLMGYGYALPYMKPYLKTTNRSFAMMSRQLGVHNWPSEGNNIVCLSEDDALPLETNSVDFVLMVHALEFLDDPEDSIAEIWRVMRSTGRLMIVVPNRMGFWARADWSPLGQGRPYSATQVERFLTDNLFVHERTTQALFTPPFKNEVLLRGADFFEKIGRFLFPALGGVHIIEASKQLYAGKHKGSKIGILDKAKASVTAKPVPTNRV